MDHEGQSVLYCWIGDLIDKTYQTLLPCGIGTIIKASDIGKQTLLPRQWSLVWARLRRLSAIAGRSVRSSLQTCSNKTSSDSNRL